MWRPYHPRTALIQPIGYDGVTESGLRVMTDPRRPKRRGIVLNTYQCAFLVPGDSVVFLDGRYDEVWTGSGEYFGRLFEIDVIAVVDDDGIPRMIPSEGKLLV